MITNEIVEKGSLPIVSKEEKVRDNCMKLYTYLVTLSIPDFSNRASRERGRRQFQQKDFTLNKIHTILGMDAKTIKKYWQQLELDGLVKYVGGAKVDRNLTWEKNFMARKKYPEGYYHIDRPEKFRKIPKDTVTKILQEYLVSELELKIYLMLGNVQEYYYNKGGVQNIQITYKDLIVLLGMKNEKQNRVAIKKALVWLKEIGLIVFEQDKRKAGNFNFEVECINLIQVNFYIDPANTSIDNSDYELISLQDKEEIIKMSLEQE